MIRDKNGDIAFFCNVHGDNDGRMMERITPLLNLLPQEEWDRLGIRVVGKKLNLVDHISEYIAEGNHQIILTGAPGTGKTYSARKYVEKYVKANYQDKFQEHFCFVQFHPSYDYTDFVEGLRPVNLLGQDNPTFVRMDGIFKAFCRKIASENKRIKDNDKKYFFIIDEINRADLSKVFGELMFALEEDNRGEDNSFPTQYNNLKTYRNINENDIGKTYFDTVITKEHLGHAIPLEEDIFSCGFYIPQNIYIIGTMNDIDRSVEVFDLALRRRFHWVQIRANDYMESSLEEIFNTKIGPDTDAGIDTKTLATKLSDKVKNMNGIITDDKYKQFGLSEAYHIGAAYFKNLSRSYTEEELGNIFEFKIVPLLREYTRGHNSEQVDNFIEDCKKELLK